MNKKMLSILGITSVAFATVAVGTLLLKRHKEDEVCEIIEEFDCEGVCDVCDKCKDCSVQCHDEIKDEEEHEQVNYIKTPVTETKEEVKEETIETPVTETNEEVTETVETEKATEKTEEKKEEVKEEKTSKRVKKNKTE